MEMLLGSKLSALKTSQGRIIVQHPGSAAILPFMDDPACMNPRIVLIKQSRHFISNDRPLSAQAQRLKSIETIEIPAGILDVKNETPLQAALRELHEETGLTAKRVMTLPFFYPSVGCSSEKIHLFAACDLQGEIRPSEDSEHTKPFCTTLDTCLADIKEGRITDGKTIVAILSWMQTKMLFGWIPSNTTESSLWSWTQM